MSKLAPGLFVVTVVLVNVFDVTLVSFTLSFLSGVLVSSGVFLPVSSYLPSTLVITWISDRSRCC